MEDTLTCPKCKMENAYFNGVGFTCPDCDCTWSADSDKMLLFDDADENSEFDKLAGLNAPFFQLEHGKLYACSCEPEKGIEDTSIIPLAFKKGKNIQFIMTNARELFKENPGFVREIITMDYEYIYNDGIMADYPSNFSVMTFVCATERDGTLIDDMGFVFFDFKRTDEI